jgi:rhodanese-related sulfurtransferase
MNQTLQPQAPARRRRILLWLSFSAVAVLVGLVIALSGCTLEGQGTPSDTLEVQEVTSQEAFDLIQENDGNPDLIILDVRTASEFHAGHIEGALSIDVNLPSFSEELEQLDRNATYLVYCRSGNRSRTALAIMEDLGFTLIYHLTNGITEWVGAGLPVSQ